MISKFFIERPIFANVIAFITIIIGAVFLYRLPVAQYPEIVPPTVQVSTRYPGASAEVVAATIDHSHSACSVLCADARRNEELPP